MIIPTLEAPVSQTGFFPVAEVRAFVAGVLADLYRPLPDEEIWEWAERTLRLVGTENSEESGMFWRSARAPYVREMMRFVRTPGKGEFWIKKSSQVGVSLAMIIIICWYIVHSAGNIGYALDNNVEMRNFSQTRLKRMILDNHLLEQINESEDELKSLIYTLRDTTVYLMSAQSAGAWANKSLSLVFLDELDRHPPLEGEGTTISLARERAKRPRDSKIFGYTTPGQYDHIDGEFAKGTMEEIHIPFPCCGHYQPLKREKLVYSTAEFRNLLGDELDLELVRRNAHFCCELCGEKFYNHQKSAALDKYYVVATNPNAQPNVRSLHIWDAYSDFRSFGEIALEMIAAEGDQNLTDRLYRGTFAEQPPRDGGDISLRDLLKCRNAYQRGELPPDTRVVLQAIDNQQDVSKAVKVAISTNGDMHIVDWHTTLSLEEAIEWASDPLVCPATGESQSVYTGFIDIGHDQTNVIRTLRPYLPLFWPVKGRGGLQVTASVATGTIHVDGEPILFYKVDDDGYKWNLYNKLRFFDQLGEKGKPRLFFPRDARQDEDFMREFLTERPALTYLPNGREKYVWTLKKGDKNDYWDCVKYILALWDVIAE